MKKCSTKKVAKKVEKLEKMEKQEGKMYAKMAKDHGAKKKKK